MCEGGQLYYFEIDKKKLEESSEPFDICTLPILVAHLKGFVDLKDDDDFTGSMHMQWYNLNDLKTEEEKKRILEPYSSTLGFLVKRKDVFSCCKTLRDVNEMSELLNVKSRGPNKRYEFSPGYFWVDRLIEKSIISFRFGGNDISFGDQFDHMICLNTFENSAVLEYLFEMGKIFVKPVIDYFLRFCEEKIRRGEFLIHMMGKSTVSRMMVDLFHIFLECDNLHYDGNSNLGSRWALENIYVPILTEHNDKPFFHDPFDLSSEKKRNEVISYLKRKAGGEIRKGVHILKPSPKQSSCFLITDIDEVANVNESLTYSLVPVKEHFYANFTNYKNILIGFGSPEKCFVSNFDEIIMSNRSIYGIGETTNTPLYLNPKSLMDFARPSESVDENVRETAWQPPNDEFYDFSPPAFVSSHDGRRQIAGKRKIPDTAEEKLSYTSPYHHQSDPKIAMWQRVSQKFHQDIRPHSKRGELQNIGQFGIPDITQVENLLEAARKIYPSGPSINKSENSSEDECSVELVSSDESEPFQENIFSECPEILEIRRLYGPNTWNYRQSIQKIHEEDKKFGSFGDIDIFEPEKQEHGRFSAVTRVSTKAKSETKHEKMEGDAQENSDFFYEQYVLTKVKDLLDIPIYSLENGKTFSKDELFCLISYALILGRLDFIELCRKAQNYIRLKDKVSKENRDAFNDMSEKTKGKVENFFVECLQAGLAMRRCNTESDNFKYESSETKKTDNNFKDVEEFSFRKLKVDSYDEQDERVINDVGRHVMKAKEIYESLSFVGKNYIREIETIEILENIDHVKSAKFMNTFDNLAFGTTRDDNSCMRLASTSFIATSVCFLRGIDRLPEKYSRLDPHKMQKIL